MITITENLKQRIVAERQKQARPMLMLRVAVDSGGCSGFQYQFSWEDGPATPEDTIYGEAVIIDEISLPFLGDSTVDFIKTLIGENFKVINPSATSGCGCGQSFSA